MKTPAGKKTVAAPKPRPTRSRRIAAKKMPPSADVRFVSLLRRKCVRAASVGALSGTGASIAGDALARAGVKRLVGRAGGIVASRVLPLTAIATSALSNAAVTYAIGKRAQAVARLRHAPIRAMPDALRAFSGVDERRVYAWSVAAVKDTLGLIGRSFGRFATASLRSGMKRLRRGKT